jgi:hypothetical protein
MYAIMGALRKIPFVRIKEMDDFPEVVTRCLEDGGFLWLARSLFMHQVENTLSDTATATRLPSFWAEKVIGFLRGRIY